MKTEKCPGCGALFAPHDGPTHRYMESSPACWAAFGEVLAREYSDAALLHVHRLSVDTYAAQHPGQPSRQSIQSVGLHLVRLCLTLERGVAPERANAAMLAAGRSKHMLTWLEPPASLGAVTVRDVAAARDGKEHAALVRRWVASAWIAWAPHHATIREWATRAVDTSALR